MADDNKKFPESSESIRDILNMKPSADSIPAEEVPQATTTPPDNLPVLDVTPNEAPDDIAKQVVEAEVAHPEVAEELSKSSAQRLVDQLHEKGNEALLFPFSFIRAAAPYLLIFGLALALYFFYFSDFSINSFFNNNQLRLESILSNDDRDRNLEKLKEENREDYLAWIGQFFVDVNDGSIIDMDTDVSGNGLTNFEKYLLNLNPKVYSTRDDIGDGQAVIEGINPWTGEEFTSSQKELVDKYINKELISNRITAAALTRGITKFAEYVNEDSPYYVDPEVLANANLANTFISSPGYVSSSGEHNNNNSSGNSSAPNNISPVIGAFPQSGSAVSLNNSGEGIDKSKPAQLDIPSYNISVPLVWTKDVRDFDQDLKRGVVHYPGTAMPGDIGTAYISGHSSGYFWDNSPYREVFEQLGQVADGTSFTITATKNNGKKVRYNYVVQRRGEFAANDQAQFISTAESIVALSTCWPVGTTDRRLVLFSKLTQVEQI